MREVAEALKRFIAEKQALAETVAAAEGKQVLPELKDLFAAGQRRDLAAVERVIGVLRGPAPEGRDLRGYSLHGTQWATAFEIWGALREFSGENKFALAFGREIFQAVPAGSVYFGGTDAGRFTVTALSRSHANGDPFFTIAQNALVDEGYLQYLQSMYGGRLWTPTREDFTGTHNAYVADALERKRENKLKPGEMLDEVNGKIEVRGQVGIMAMNGMLSKRIFDQNADREFYVEESFPLEWMYPHLAPHGPVLRIHREKLAQLSVETVQRDRAYWTRQVHSLIDRWLGPGTPVADVTAFVERVHWRHDYSAFHGDPAFIEGGGGPQQMFSKLRSAIGGVYAWRAREANSQAERERMTHEADFAFRQAFALAPRSPEAVFRYVNHLASERRHDDAILVTDAAVTLAPKDGNLSNLATELRRMRQATFS